jgi:hypothetical protein
MWATDIKDTPMTTLIKDLIDIPERVQRTDFVLNLTYGLAPEAVERVAQGQTLRYPHKFAAASRAWRSDHPLIQTDVSPASGLLRSAPGHIGVGARLRAI